ncbi:chaperone modulator CbpM [Polaromonas sp.]|uniref:chaperone modulator CbpM n=1 Tax=Polaromonas sp. TaxID=1869339 RepID=UPI00286A41B9|nr:chaperone modulator CbpM [Polaromonas sp.]
MSSTTTPTATYLSSFILEDQTELTLDEVCRACAAQTDMIVELVNEGVLEPDGPAPGEWRFTGLHLHQARVAVRLQRDLGVNLAGVALALQLLQEMDSLRAQLRRLAGE